MTVRYLSLLLVLLLCSCSYIPFVGDDDDGGSAEDKPVAKKKEKIKTILVYTAKGELQCEEDSGASTKATKARLVSNGVEVYSSECAIITGMMHPSLCGSTTLDINVHAIDENDIGLAEKLDFKTIESLEDQDDLGYQAYPCDL